MDYKTTNSLALDAKKDNYKPQISTEISEDVVKELLYGLGINFDGFFIEIKNSGEYITNKGKRYFWTKDVAECIYLLKIK